MKREYAFKQLMICGFLVGAMVLPALSGAFKEPEPGDIFREHVYYESNWIRVGGRLDQGQTPRTWPGSVDLVDATKAMIRIQKLLCHDDTKGLAISVNGKPYIEFPESAKIPMFADDYQHMTYPTVDVPLGQLKTGQNTFKMKVDPEHYWQWPQNIVYGIELMVFYKNTKAHPTGSITNPKANAEVGLSVKIDAAATAAGSPIHRVDFIGLYDDFNYEGDGVYRQWHYLYLRNKMMFNLGSDLAAPYTTTWNTSWVPDQKEPMKIAARIVDKSGMVYITPAVEGVKLVRQNHSVDMYKPFSVPKAWVTRTDSFTTLFSIPQSRDLAKIKGARMVFVSWSAEYCNGIYVNNNKVLDKPVQHPPYEYAYHEESVNKSFLKSPMNIIKTGLTPKKIVGNDTTMVHGMEINWPGIIMLVQYNDKSAISPAPRQGAAPTHSIRAGNMSWTGLSARVGEKVAVYTLDGRKVFSQQLGSGRNEISTKGFAPGIYFLRIGSAGNGLARRFCVMK